MPKLFSCISWNVEHFKKSIDSTGVDARCKRVVKFIKDQDPDVIALYEIEGGDIFLEIVSKMPNYTFHITEGPQVQEILVGVRHGISAFFTQKLAFKSGVSSLRPGAILTLTINDEHYPLLFLHTKSAKDPRSFGLRDDIINKSIKFINTLKKAGGAQQANFIVMGDLNTMGMDIKNLDRNISAEMEIDRISYRAERYYDMLLLDKTYPKTWSNGSSSSIPDSDLDHVIAAEHLTFQSFTRHGTTASVDIRGWSDSADQAAKDKWIEDYSDHNLLYFEVIN